MGTSIYQSIPVDILKEGTKRNVDSSSECMKYQFFRLSSFESFPPKSDGRPLKLAKAGFLFTPRHPEDDTVTCFSCQTTRNNWTRFDDPMEIHQSLNPDCEFIKGTSGNVEIAVPKDGVCQMIKAGLREKYGERNDEERNDDTGANDVPQSPSELANPVPDCVPSRTKDHSAKEPRENSPPSVEDQAEGRFPYTGLGITPVIPPVHRRPQLTTDGATDPPNRSQMLINESTNNASIVLAADISRNTMVREEARLRTFTHWPRNLVIRPPALTRVGFYYLGSFYRVQCAFCKGIIRDWDEAESPVAEHWRYFSNCPFMRGLDDRNIPLIPGDTFVSDYVTAHPQDSNNDDQTSPGNPLATILNKGTAQQKKASQCFCQMIKAERRKKYGERNDEVHERSPQISTNVDPRSSESPRSNRRSLSDSLSGLGITPVIPPVHRRPQLTTDGATDPPNRRQMLINESTNNASIVLAADVSRNTMVREEARLRTFTHWPRNLVIRPPALARVGFYYLGSSDRVQCAFCKGILSDWDEAETPVAEHWRYFSNCRFMRGLDDRNIGLIPGDTFVSDYVTAHPRDSYNDDQTSPGNPLTTILNKGTAQAIREGRTAGKRFSDDDDDDDDDINLKHGKRSRSNAEKPASGEYTSDDHAGQDTSGQQVRNSRHDQSTRDIIRNVVRKILDISCRYVIDDEDEDDSDPSS